MGTRKFFIKNLLLVFFLFHFGEVKVVVAQNGPRLSVKTKESTIEIGNGLLGVVIPRQNSFQPGAFYPAPIQAFIFSDNRYSGNNVSRLSSRTPPVAMEVQFVRNTSNVVTVRISYRFNKTEFTYGQSKYPGGEAGVGFYQCTITVKRGEKSILIEEDSNYDISYSVDISKGWRPDKARYRGWSSSALQYGYEPSGDLYRPEHQRGYPLDATVDINYSKPQKYPRMVLWEPAGGEVNSGRYWQLFDSKGNDNSPLFGFFQGSPKRLIGGRSAGVQLEIVAEKGLETRAALSVDIERRGPDNSWYPRKRFQWAAFISTKSDLLSPEKQQPIATELNRIAGLGSVINDYSEHPVSIVPSFYTGAVYMSASDIQSLCRGVKTDAELYKTLCTIDGPYKAIWDAWRYPDSAIALKKMLLSLPEKMKIEYVSGEGTYARQYRYWTGSNAFKYYAFGVSALFADEQIPVSNSEKKKLEQLIGMMARIVWDDNNVPLTDSSGINFGPANMPFMYNNSGRVFFALLLANDPEFKARAKAALESVNNDIDRALYDNGSSIGTPHYTQPTIEPILFSMLQLKQAGVADVFKSNKKIEAFARFYTTLLTPPSVRFSNNRKLISFGDGSEESASVFGLLATGLEDVNQPLSEELRSAFFYGPLRASAFGPIALSANLRSIPDKRFSSTTSSYSGYLSHFRSGINTDNETALWVLNGDGLFDHRNDDAGEVAMYALKAPLSLSRSSFYYPSATDAKIRSVLIPEKLFPEWNTSSQPITGRSLTNRTWSLSSLQEFATLGYSSTASIKMSTPDGASWYRKTNMITVQEELPILVFYDSTTGNQSNIWSMPMMSHGAVSTPAGNLTPVKRMYDNGNLKELPQASPEKQLAPGLSRFVFTGQNWKAHLTGGIDWDMYTVSSSNTGFTISSWGTTWQNAVEKDEFYITNNKPYSEEQQIIRLKSDSPFFNVILPYNKGKNPYSNKVTQIAYNTISIQQTGGRVVINPNYYIVKTEEKLYAALLSSKERLDYEEIIISGGYTELEYNKDLVKVRVHGNTGRRKIILPFAILEEVVHVGNAKVTIKREALKSTIEIDYQSMSLDLPSGEKGFDEFIFKRR